LADEVDSWRAKDRRRCEVAVVGVERDRSGFSDGSLELERGAKGADVATAFV